jgi:tRNA-modifying protein YgfZ
MGADDNERMSSPQISAAAAQGATRLTDWGVILARGPDAPSFLHSQLTQAVQGLSPDRAKPAGYCSAKGRLLASLVLWKPESEIVALACSADLLAPTLKRLSMFVLRAKCKLEDASGSLPLWGLAGAAAGRWLGSEAQSASAWKRGERSGSPGSHWIRLPDVQGVPRWLWAAPVDTAAPELPALDAAHWAWLEVRSGVPRVVAATVEHFVPQMINLELVGGVDFQKGCYPGQEVVARSQYRGTLKRRMVLVDASGPVAPAAEVHHSSDPGQPAGEVVLAAPGPDGRWSAQVELKLAMLAADGTLRCGDALLTPLPLPYALPADAA